MSAQNVLHFHRFPTAGAPSVLKSPEAATLRQEVAQMRSFLCSNTKIILGDFLALILAPRDSPEHHHLNYSFPPSTHSSDIHHSTFHQQSTFNLPPFQHPGTPTSQRRNLPTPSTSQPPQVPNCSALQRHNIRNVSNCSYPHPSSS